LQLVVGAIDAFGVDLLEDLAEIVPFRFKDFLPEHEGSSTPEMVCRAKAPRGCGI